MSHHDFAIEPLTVSNLHACAEIFTHAFAPACLAIFPHGANKAMLDFRKAELVNALTRAESERPSSLYPSREACAGGMRGKIRAVVVRLRKTGQVAGFYLFELYEAGVPADCSQRVGLDGVAYPPGANRAQYEKFWEVAATEKRRWMKDETFAYFCIAAVNPTFRSSGARGALSAYANIVLLTEWNDPWSYTEALPLASKLWAKLEFERLQEYDITALLRQSSNAVSSAAAESEDLHFVVHAMKRRSVAQLVKACGGIRGALSVLVPRTKEESEEALDGQHSVLPGCHPTDPFSAAQYAKL
ncbi:hypothetical protein V8E36_000713 [Tilletia maclaganii]